MYREQYGEYKILRLGTEGLTDYVKGFSSLNYCFCLFVCLSVCLFVLTRINRIFLTHPSFSNESGSYASS